MLRPMRKLGIFGCGNIARYVAAHLGAGRPDAAASALGITAVYDRHADRRAALAARAGARECASIAGLLAEDVDLVVETASVAGAREHALTVLEAGKDLVILSAGALMDAALRSRLEAAASRTGRRIYLPSGAVAGLDLMRAGRGVGFSRLLLRTTKPPAGLDAEVSERTCLFRGPAEECVRLFPRNINVAASLSIASGAALDVEIWADPQASYNTHEVIAEGDFGSADLRLVNHPSPDNPRTSYLAALSLIALLTNLDSPLQVGA